MRIWPDTLPGPILDGYELSPFDQTRRTQMEGAIRVRRITRARQDSVQVPWLFTDRQFALFRQWWGDEIISAVGDSDDLTGWATAEASVAADQIVGPDGVLADRLLDNGTNDLHRIGRDLDGVIADHATLMARATFRAAGRDFAAVQILDKALTSQWATVNLTTGAIAATSGVISAEVTDRANGWWRLTVRASAGTGVNAPRMRIATAGTGGALIYAGSGTGVDVCEVQARVSDDIDGFAHADASGAALGAAGGTAWVRLPLAFGGGLSVVEARPTGMFRALPKRGLYWRVSAPFEVRNA